MKVVFSHGKESGPWGSKITRLAHTARSRGFTVDSIDYTDIMDGDERVLRLIETLAEADQKLLLVGSSLGGYVSLVASRSIVVDGLFLLAPALYMPGLAVQSYDSRCSDIEIVHGWADEVIPAEHSIRFARSAQCTLHMVQADHRLMAALDRIDLIFRLFLQRHQEFGA